MLNFGRNKLSQGTCLFSICSMKDVKNKSDKKCNINEGISRKDFNESVVCYIGTCQHWWTIVIPSSYMQS